MSTPTVVACLLSDIHLSHTAPRCRAGEPDWYEAMRGPLVWLHELLDDLGNPPVFCAGDVFDRWNPPPELINFAIECLPGMWAVAGNHDLPQHNLENIHKSGFWTLVRSGTIMPMAAGAHFGFGQPVPKSQPWKFESQEVVVVGYNWGQRPAPAHAHDNIESPVRIAVSHRYVHNGGNTTYPGSNDSDKAMAISDEYENFTIAHFGDNHIPFMRNCCGIQVVNTGGFYRRTVKEVDHRPGVVLVYSDGACERVTYDTKEEVFDDTLPVPAQVATDVTGFIESLSGVDITSGYDNLVRRWISDNDVSPNVENLIMGFLQMGGQ